MEPGSHGWQKVALGEDWYVPPSHGLHSWELKSMLIEPGVHCVGATEPVEQELPGGHGEHCDWAARLVALLKLPLSHGSGAEAPVGQTEPGSHGSQKVALGEDWYVPSTHGTHSDAPKSRLIKPGVHGVGVTEPVEQALPGGHGEHCCWADRSVALLKLPLSQGSGA